MGGMSSPLSGRFKVSVVGCGNVGATAAYALLLSGLPTELAFMDISAEKAEGLLLDFEHALSLVPHTKIEAGTSYEVCRDSDVIVITAGARQKEGETRLQLIEKNRALFQAMIPALNAVAPQSVMLVVTNPVDVLTHEAIRLVGGPRGRVFGSGTMLDTARLRFHIAQKLALNPKSIEAFVLGEHGDSSFPVWSLANVAGKSVFEFEGFTREVADACYQETKNAAYRIIHDLGYTCYSIGVVIREIVQAIADDSHLVVPLSIDLAEEEGPTGVALSLPCVLGRQGVLDVLSIPLNEQEKAALVHSAKVLKELY